MPDRYDRMTTAELEAEAQRLTEAGYTVDLGGAENNAERARRIRPAAAEEEAAASRPAPAEEPAGPDPDLPPAARDHQPAEGEDQPAEGRPAPVGQERPIEPGDQATATVPAPYPSEDDYEHRKQAAAGQVQAAQQPEGEVPPVGGQAED